ncbi:COX15/CtaA family protein [Neiella marina]|uniref:COX15/CtaA family protein n=1 Tax=Neiella holothuriorum TaxID=2870530 RepID=A0ABS7EG91_9GAMM|nr:COX15/CtaA family protein [Neiella holothuriorum]MBW8191240.1 COX15/CtaA family protein [Neiella holothuriorum]
MRVVAIVAVVLGFLVIQLGAYTRLTDAGLGCPDWPGCYGTIAVPQTEEAISAANRAFPERPVEPTKAWNEMIHRYLAGALGLLIACLAVMGWRRGGSIRRLSSGLLVLVIFQAMLGMWTVTMKLNPLVVLAHLLGGFCTLALLCVLVSCLRTTEPAISEGRRTSPWLLLALIVVLGQVLLGGWTSANYAATACTQLPVCEAGWQERFDIGGAFSLPQSDDGSYEYGRHNYQQRMTIHVFHRFGGVLTVLAVLAAALSLMQQQRRAAGLWLLLLVTVQFSLGLVNVVAHLPIAVAVGHNGGAALLFASLMVMWTRPGRHRIFGENHHG